MADTVLNVNAPPPEVPQVPESTRFCITVCATTVMVIVFVVAVAKLVQLLV